MTISMWQQRPFESYVERQLKQLLKEDGNTLWSKYVSTRDEMLNQVLPWISSQEPNLTDHGPKHIADVIDNAGLLLGMQNQHGAESSWKDPCKFNPQELLVLLTGLVMHDIGNIYGRDRHNQKIPEVWRENKGAWHAWNSPQRTLISTVGRAHSGKSPSGSKDTLEHIATAHHYFDKTSIRAGDIAAIIRFADELAEGPHRTSVFLIDAGLLHPDSELFHQYANITHVAPDRKRGSIALTYSINIDNSSYPRDPTSKKAFIADLLRMTYARAAKMNYERQFARHYAEALGPFRSISVSLMMEKNGLPLDLSLKPITLTDISHLHNGELKIETMFQEYEIDRVLNQVGL